MNIGSTIGLYSILFYVLLERDLLLLIIRLPTFAILLKTHQFHCLSPHYNYECWHLAAGQQQLARQLVNASKRYQKSIILLKRQWLTEELLRCQTRGRDPRDGLGALVKVMHKLDEEDPQAAHQAEHQAGADEHGSDHDPAPSSVWALHLVAAALRWGPGLGHGYKCQKRVN